LILGLSILQCHGYRSTPCDCRCPATAVCDIMHKARPGRGVRPFQVALLILGSSLAPTTSKVRGGPGHSREKRINLSTAELCSEAPALCAQSRSTSCGMHRGKFLLDMRAFEGCQGPHAGPPMAGRPFVSPVEKVRTQAPSLQLLALSPATPRTLFAKYGIEAWTLAKYQRIHSRRASSST